MAEYGLTNKGPNIKRLEDIRADMHANLSERWGVNTQQNPQSFINHLITNIADAIAELWEFGENVYYSQYPSSAEGASLDNVGQLGGSTRELAAKSYYPIHCTGIDGTTLSAGTKISTSTNPATVLALSSAKKIERTAFNKAAVKVSTTTESNVYTIILNGKSYSTTTSSNSHKTILERLQTAIEGSGFTGTYYADNKILNIEADDITSTNSMILSDNLTTETVTSIINFGTEEYGDIYIPNGIITNILKAEAGLLSVDNLCEYIAGREQETDTEFRQSYIDKIYNRSSMMLESIRSAILNSVQGVQSVSAYENSTNETDEMGRPPHSIEIVVDGGDSNDIAKQILARKAAGILTYGDVSVTLTGDYDEDIVIRFNRPETIYVWFQLTVYVIPGYTLPANYSDLLRAVVLKNMDAIDSGTDVIPQQFMTELHEAFEGISYIDIALYHTDQSQESAPSAYNERSVVITARQRAFTSESMIGVVLHE